MASLIELPLELRLEVYSYLLIAGNVCEKGAKLRPKFAISLFRVNKQLSGEALEYFYKKNAFTVVWFEILSPFTIQDFEAAMPSSTRAKAFPPPSDKRLPLHMRICYSGYGRARGTMVLIVPLPELSFLVHLLNKQQFGSYHTSISLLFNLQPPFFVNRGTASEKFLRALHNLRKPPHLNSYQKKSLEIALHGCFDSRFTLALDTKTMELYSDKDTLEYCQQQKNLANCLQHQRSFKDALTHLSFASILADKGASVATDTEHSKETVSSALENLSIETDLMMSVSFAELGEVTDAVKLLKRAITKNGDRQMYNRSDNFPDHPVFRAGYMMFPKDPFEHPTATVRSALAAWVPTDLEGSKLESVKDDFQSAVEEVEECRAAFRQQWSIYLPDPMAVRESVW